MKKEKELKEELKDLECATRLVERGVVTINQIQRKRIFDKIRFLREVLE